jgi:hypothetical protein
MFNCPKCLKIFKRKSHLTQHLSKLKSCDNDKDIKPNITHPINDKIHPKSEIKTDILDQFSNLIKTMNNPETDNIKKDIEISSNQCPYCNKSFFQKYNVKKHLDMNSCKIKKNMNNTEKEIITKLKELFFNSTNTNIINNNITNNITNNIQVNIYSAGKEDLSRLSQEDIIKICTSGTYYPIVAAEVIHCNKNYPEFQNFLITNLRSNTGLVFLNDDWHSKSQEELLSNIMQVDKKHVSNLIKDLKVDDKLQVKLESTKQEIEDNESKEHQKVKIKTKLYNAAKMIKNNKKNIEKKILEN